MAIKGFESLFQKNNDDNDKKPKVIGKTHRLNVQLLESQYRELQIRAKAEGFRSVKDYIINKLEL